MAERYHIRFLPQNITAEAEAGTSLYELARLNDAMPSAYCGGNGTCGKCLVDVTVAGVTSRRLACRTVIDADMTVTAVQDGQAEVLTAGSSRQVAITPRQGYSVAFDIGTTTVVCYLINGADGAELAVRGALNPQSVYGADVITRAKYVLEHGRDAMQKAVVGAMNRLILECCRAACVKAEEIRFGTVVGNTAMQHFLLGRSPEPLVLAPYMPASVAAETVLARELGLCVWPEAQICILPLIAGFVGADTVGCLLATDFPTLSGYTLMMDIGTNGEMVMGSGENRVACSTAAGPAFEGAKIYCGMRGETGAIDHVSLEGGKLSYTVIGGGKPAGVCGSGLVDLIACLLTAGTVLPSGRMSDDSAFAERITTISDGTRAFIVAHESETAHGQPVLLTQLDIRELQLAKAAMAAGVSMMAASLQIQLTQIDRVLVAGAFGNYLDAHSACAIGLIPAVLESRIVSIGNAAGEGAKLAAQSDAERRKAGALAEGTRYLELADEPDFQDEFVEQLAFPDGDGKD